VSIRVDSCLIPNEAVHFVHPARVGVSVPQIYGLTKPKQFAAAARKFPRSLPIGCG